MRSKVDFAQIIGLVIIIVALFAQSYYGRRDLVTSNRHECERAIVDRQVNMEAWWAAYLARRLQAEQSTNSTTRRVDQQAADAYRAVVISMQSRVDEAHSLEWPIRSGIHPLGLGRFSCYKANPPASPFQFFG